MFRAPAFAPAADGMPLIRRVVDESRRHASALAADMRRDVVDAAEAIIQGALDHPGNADVIGDRPARDFMSYSRRACTSSTACSSCSTRSHAMCCRSAVGAPTPRPTQSTTSSSSRVAGAPARDGRYFHETLTTLFSLLWDGPVEAAQSLGIEPVGGELFDPGRTATLDCVHDSRRRMGAGAHIDRARRS